MSSRLVRPSLELECFASFFGAGTSGRVSQQQHQACRQCHRHHTAHRGARPAERAGRCVVAPNRPVGWRTTGGSSKLLLLSPACRSSQSVTRTFCFLEQPAPAAAWLAAAGGHSPAHCRRGKHRRAAAASSASGPAWRSSLPPSGAAIPRCPTSLSAHPRRRQARLQPQPPPREPASASSSAPAGPSLPAHAAHGGTCGHYEPPARPGGPAGR